MRTYIMPGAYFCKANKLSKLVKIAAIRVTFLSYTPVLLLNWSFMTYICNKMLQLRIKYIKRLNKKEIRQKDVMFALDVSRKTVSIWLAKYRVEGEAGLTPKKSGPKSGTTWNRTPDDIESAVVALAEDHPFKGPDWLADQLYESGIILNQSTVYRILKRKKARYYETYKHKRRKKKAYCLDRPGRELQIDVNFPFGYARKEVVYDAIDDCSRFVFAQMMPSHTGQSSLVFMKLLIEKCPFKIEAIRTDCCREFSKAVTTFLQGHDIEHRKNPPYTPQHNGKIERYHRTFKENEACYWSFHAPLHELNYRLQLWLDYYNYRKRHTGLGMNKMTPVQKIIYAFVYHSFLPHKNGNLILQQNKSCHLNNYMVQSIVFRPPAFTPQMQLFLLGSDLIIPWAKATSKALA